MDPGRGAMRETRVDPAIQRGSEKPKNGNPIAEHLASTA